MTTLPNTLEDLTIYTGNILALNDIKGKPKQTTSEELIESLKITLSGWKYVDGKNHSDSKSVELVRENDDLLQKMSEVERKDLKIGVKLFVNHENSDGIKQAISSTFEALKTETIDNLIISYNSGVIKQNDNTESTVDILPNLKKVWSLLEEYTKTEKISQLGVSDLDEQQFRDLYSWATVKPSIIQINLASCCVVPPTLQEFCNQKSIQLLTHSDSIEIFPENSMEKVFGNSFSSTLFWTIRFQIHIRCRGVLSSKGYIVNFRKNV